MRLNGLDITDTGVDVRPNEDLNGLEVELTTQLSDLSGFVTSARGENIKDYSIVVFSRDRERWGFASRYLGGGRPDQDGKYRVRSLPPATATRSPWIMSNRAPAPIRSFSTG